MTFSQTAARPTPGAPTRVVLVTGKGGVGKTTIAGATATRAAARGSRVLVTSTDPAHSLGDLFATPLGDEPVRVAPNVDALQLDGQQRLERHWAQVREWLVEVLVAGGASRLQAGELVLLPGMEELFALLDVQARVDAGAHDLVVVDCAPTAETLRLLALPEALAFYADRVLGPGRRLARIVRPVSRSVVGVPVPDDDVFGAVDDVRARLARVQALLTDPERTAVRLVVTPERMVLAEARRTATALALFGHPVDAVVVNRVLEPQAAGSPLREWHDRQRTVLDEVDEAFAAWPRPRVAWAPVEPVGAERLARLGAALYGDADPGVALHDGDGIVVEPDGDEAVLVVPLPFARSDEVDLHRRGADLHLQVAGAKRVLALPPSLAGHDVVGAGLVDGALRVRLAAPVAEVAS